MNSRLFLLNQRSSPVHYRSGSSTPAAGQTVDLATEANRAIRVRLLQGPARRSGGWRGLTRARNLALCWKILPL